MHRNSKHTKELNEPIFPRPTRKFLFCFMVIFSVSFFVVVVVVPTIANACFMMVNEKYITLTSVYNIQRLYKPPVACRLFLFFYYFFLTKYIFIFFIFAVSVVHFHPPNTHLPPFSTFSLLIVYLHWGKNTLNSLSLSSSIQDLMYMYYRDWNEWKNPPFILITGRKNSWNL